MKNLINSLTTVRYRIQHSRLLRRSKSIVDAYNSNATMRRNEGQLSLIKLMDKINVNLHRYETDKRFRYLMELQKKDYPVSQPRGLYIYGPVGTGKTMLMDMMFDCSVDKKLRVHFHKFCLDVHRRIHVFKKLMLEKHGRDTNLNVTPERDAIVHVAGEISSLATVLMFDEFQITDIADALIMKKLFSELW